MERVRKAEPRDIENMETICLETAPAEFCKNQKTRETTLLRYNRYYTRHSLSNCFVLTDDADRAVGYILCADDFKSYFQNYCQHEVKKIAKLGVFRAVLAIGEALLMSPFAKQYPAHLHIDILPKYQGQGNGSLLMQTLFAQQKRNGTKGIMLCVGKTNTRAIAFYEKQGFQKLRTIGGGIFMGKGL